MLKKCSISFLIVLSIVCWCDNDTTHARSNQAPIFNASAPGMSSCVSSGCHGTNELNAGPGGLEILATFDGEENVYTDGSLIDINLTITDPNASRYGFQMVAVDGNGIGVGNFITGDDENLAIQEAQGLEFIGHFEIPQTNDNTFSFQFQAPDENVGPISFYATGLAADGLGSPADDFPYSDGVDLFWTEPSTIDEGVFSGLALAPNPSTDRMVQLRGINFEKAQVQVIDLNGKLRQTFTYQPNVFLDLSELDSGLYIVKVSNKQYQVSRKLILR